MRNLLVLSLVSLLSAPVAQAVTLECDGMPITVRADTPELAMRVCNVARTSLADLASCGVSLSLPHTIEIVDDIKSDCMGLYHCGTQRIEVLSPGTMAKRRLPDSAFSDIPTDRYFDSIILHELTHAAYESVPCPYGTCTANAEYVAYAMQIRSLSDVDRSAFEASYAIDREISGDEFSAITYFMAPDRFAQKAWAHFTQRPDGCGYVKQIMNGTIMLDRERP